MERGAVAELVPDRIDNDIISACLISGISGFFIRRKRNENRIERRQDPGRKS